MGADIISLLCTVCTLYQLRNRLVEVGLEGDGLEQVGRSRLSGQRLQEEVPLLEITSSEINNN